MYHDVMNPKPRQVWVTIPIPKCKKPINHEIQLLFKYENLLLCVCVGVCVCVYVWNISLAQNSHLFIYLGFLYSG